MTWISVALAILIENHPWSGWKEGTTVTLRITTVSGTTKVVREETYAVAKVDGTTVTLNVSVNDAGKKSSRQDTVNAVESNAKPGGTEKGKESITIDGVKLDCTILQEDGFEGADKFTGTKVTTKHWTCPDAPTPGGLVKEETSGVQASVKPRSSTFRLTRLKESISVKGQSFSCWATERVQTENNQKTTEKIWRSKQMPGWTVKAEWKVEANGGVTTVTTEVIVVEIKK